MNNLLSILLMTPGAGGGGYMQFLPFLMIIVVMYFFMIRPQQRKAKEQQSFKETLNKGDKVVTIGGIHGRIVEKRDTTLIIEVATGVRLEIERSAVSMELTKGQQGNMASATPLAEK